MITDITYSIFTFEKLEKMLDHLSRRGKSITANRIKFLKQYLKSDVCTAIIAENGDRDIIGVVTLYKLLRIERDYYYGIIEDVYVDEKDRRHQIGTTLIQKCIKKAKKEGIKQISLVVEKSNHTAKRFYEKLGFEDKENGMSIFI